MTVSSMQLPIISARIKRSHTSLEILSKQINKDLKNCLKADNINIHRKRIELVIFRSRKSKIDHSFKLKLDGKRLMPTKSVKYLRVQLEEHLHRNWEKHVKMKLNRAIGILLAN